MPAFLLEVMGCDERVKHSVQVNINQIIEILGVGAGNRIRCAISAGEGVDKRVKRPFEQLDKRLFDLVFTRAAENGMFHDVGQPGGIGRWGAEVYAKNLVLVFVGE